MDEKQARMGEEGARMNEEQLAAYFERIGKEQPETLDAQTLFDLVHAHQSSIPFEATNIYPNKIPLSLDLDDLHDKMVTRKRGGICYEMATYFGAVLEALGANVEYLYGSHPMHGHPFDHAFLRVNVGNETDGDDVWLVDVGLAQGLHDPLRFDVGVEQSDGFKTMKLIEAPELGEGFLRLMHVKDGEETEYYAFGPQTCDPSEYEPRMRWYEVAPGSRFIKGPFIGIDNEEGRVMLSFNRLTWWEDGEMKAKELTDDEAQQALADIFGL